MKKIFLLLLLVLISLNLTAQENDKNKYPQDVNKNTELKINALTLLAATWLDFSYEKLINEESSFGTTLTLNTDTDRSDLKYAITPFYRRYFSSKFARGFFIEGFGMLFESKDTPIFDSNKDFNTGFALGFSVGGKFVSKQGFTTELLLGLGRNLINTGQNSVVGRIGVSLGYRF